MLLWYVYNINGLYFLGDRGNYAITFLFLIQDTWVKFYPHVYSAILITLSFADQLLCQKHAGLEI